jgi:hypothetical protein
MSIIRSVFHVPQLLLVIFTQMELVLHWQIYVEVSIRNILKIKLLQLSYGYRKCVFIGSVLTIYIGSPFTNYIHLTEVLLH